MKQACPDGKCTDCKQAELIARMSDALRQSNARAERLANLLREGSNPCGPGLDWNFRARMALEETR